MFEAEYYDKEYLKKEDRSKLDEIEMLREELLNADNISEFLETCVSGGEVTKALVGEQLAAFSEFLKKRMDYYICDFIISKIDDYPDSEYEMLKKEADERRRLLEAGADAPLQD